MIIFIFIAAVGSLMVSYTKARAEGLGIECKTGLLARPERVIVLAIGLLSNTGIWALALLAVFSHLTAVERMIAVWRSAPVAPVMRNQAYSHRQDASKDNLHLPTMLEPDEGHGSNIRPVPTSIPPFNGGVQQD
jgi:CDP-diacylglycerol--glycerol-3-phosphate 3-phosphatidyltransferase